MTETLTDGRSVFYRKTYDEAVALAQRTYGCLSMDRHRSHFTGGAASSGGSRQLLYTAELMRLSTRIMYAVAWLMNRRAVMNGEITSREALSPERRLGPADNGALVTCERLAPEDIPNAVRDLMDEADRLYARLERLEADLLSSEVDGAMFAPSDHIDDLRPWGGEPRGGKPH